MDREIEVLDDTLWGEKKKQINKSCGYKKEVSCY